MNNTWTNPNPNLNISLLNNQYSIFISIMQRMRREQRYTEAEVLKGELMVLRKLIIENESK